VSRVVGLAVMFAALCVLHADARADAAAADAAEKQAQDLAAAGDFAGAATKYREAYAADPRIELMCNVGIAYHKAKDLPRAQLYLSHCLKRGVALEAQFVASVRGVLATVEGALKAGDFTPVDIVVDPEATSVTIDDASFIGPHLLWLPYGKHELAFHAGGYVDQSIEIEVTGRETTPISVKLEKQPDPKPIVIEKPIKLHRSAHSIYPAIGASAFTGAAIIFAVVAFTKAHRRADVAAFAVSDTIHDDDAAYIDKWNNRLALGGIAALLGAGASGWLWYRALSSSTEVEVLPARAGAQVTFRMTF
jgi:hypothetical protein